MSRPLPSSLDNTDFFEESAGRKLLRRLKEEPLIPVGCALTVVALYKASRSIRRGDKETTNKMFRMRIYAQGFTLAAMVAGSFYYAKERDERKEWDAKVREKKADEKREAWIRELELRDQEEKEFKERARRLALKMEGDKEAQVEGIAQMAKEALEKKKGQQGVVEKAVEKVVETVAGGKKD